MLSCFEVLRKNAFAFSIAGIIRPTTHFPKIVKGRWMYHLNVFVGIVKDSFFLYLTTLIIKKQVLLLLHFGW